VARGAWIDVGYDRSAFLRMRRRIRGMAARSANVSPAWQVFLDWFTDQNRQQFGQHGARYGQGWRPLKPATVAAKRRLGYTGDILVRDRTLERSVTDRPLPIERVGPHDMEAGTNVHYAKFHQFGAPRARLPQRKLWDVAVIEKEGAAASALRTWISSGKPRVVVRKGR
jgi:hypothetical protein